MLGMIIGLLAQFGGTWFMLQDGRGTFGLGLGMVVAGSAWFISGVVEAGVGSVIRHMHHLAQPEEDA